MFKEMLIESLNEKVVKESVVAPYVGQQVIGIGKDSGGQIVFANGKVVKIKDAKGDIKIYPMKDFSNKFSMAGEVANESQEKIEDITFFTLDFVSEDLTDDQVASMLRDVADMIENGEKEGTISDEDDNEIGSFCYKCSSKEVIDDELDVKTDEDEDEDF